MEQILTWVATWEVWLVLGLSLVAVAAVIWGRFRRVQVPRPYQWGAPPAIYVVDLDAMAGVHEAVRKLRDLTGHDLGPVIVASTVGESRGIWVVPWDERAALERGADHETQGQTTVLEALGSHLDLVHVSVRPSRVGDALVIAHELAHALGYAHPSNPPTGHLMAPVGRVGWDVRGLEA